MTTTLHPFTLLLHCLRSVRSSDGLTGARPLVTTQSAPQEPVAEIHSLLLNVKKPAGQVALRKCKYPLMGWMQMDAFMTIAPRAGSFCEWAAEKAITITQQNYACRQGLFSC